MRAAYVRAVQSEGGAQYAGRVSESGTVSFDSQSTSSRRRQRAMASTSRQPARPAQRSAYSRMAVWAAACAPPARRRWPAQTASATATATSSSGIRTAASASSRASICRGSGLPHQRRRGGAQDRAINHALRAALSGVDGAQSLLLRDEANDTVLHYSDLFAQDADGKSVPVKMALSESGNELTLRIDDRGARYPLQIDPLIWAQVNGAVKTSDPDNGDNFGFSISSAGDTAVVGAPLDDAGGTDAGAIYVFTMSSQGTWSQRVKVAGPSAGANYGWSVGISKLSAGDYRIVAGAPQDSSAMAWRTGTAVPGTPGWRKPNQRRRRFGFSVGVSGDRVIVGAYGEASNDGVARIFEPDPASRRFPGTRPQPSPMRRAALARLAWVWPSMVISPWSVSPLFDVGATDDGRAFIWYQHNPARWLDAGSDADRQRSHGQCKLWLLRDGCRA